MNEYINKTFLVTGATSGIGAAIALNLNNKGAKIICIGRSSEKFEQLKTQVSYPDKFFFEAKDLSVDIETLPAYVKELAGKYGKFNGCVASAGITEVRPLRALDIISMKKLFDINYFSPIFLAKGFADKRVNQGAGSAFVAVGSIACNRPAKAVITYSGSKAALVTSFVAIAKEFASSGIRFNTVSPSDIETPMVEALADLMEQVKPCYPMGFGKPEDVANVVSFLLSDQAKWITGQNYVIDCASR